MNILIAGIDNCVMSDDTRHSLLEEFYDYNVNQEVNVAFKIVRL